MTTAAVPESLRAQLARLDARRSAFAGLPAPVVESLYGRLRIELTHASNAIEGNTLSLRETQLVVEEGLSPGAGKTVREIYEARNHFAAVRLVEHWLAVRRDITSAAVLDLHQAILRDIDDTWSGRLRNGPVFIRGTRHTPPNAARVSDELDALVHDASTATTCHPVLSAAEIHFRFEALHPFFDGNGRTGRLLLNWQLLRAGFPLTVIRFEQRARYLDALDRGHIGDLLPLQMLVADAVEQSLDLATSGT